MRIGLLGPLEVRDDAGELLPLAGGRLRTLLSRFALDPGRTVTHRQLIDAVWGDEPPDGAANALQALVSRLRRALPDLTVHSGPTGYRLDVDPQWTDVARFERLARSGRALAAADRSKAADDLRAALALWRGPALLDADGAAFAQAAAVRLTELRLAALEELASVAPPAEAAAMVPDLTAALHEFPTRERLVAALMRTLWTDGRPADALAVYERARVAIADQFGTDPAAELRELHLTILRAAQDEATPVPSAAPPSNLRNAITSFVGRDEEVARVRALVTNARLVTLVGPGGAGKTRLAVEAARGLVDASPDGVWLIELAPVTDPAEVPATVLATLGLREQGLLGNSRNRVTMSEPGDPTARVVAALSDQRALLVLDNCEHLIGAAADLADRLVAECPYLRVLGTSREPLAITGETLWTVEPLTTPPAGADPATALAYSAVRLLADRGAAARPGFVVDLSNVDDVIELCRGLDGMPLAIELAAARLRTMTPAQIAGRLDDRFRLLTAGSRTALPRHQTLRAVVDWSWELLDDDERTLLRRLAVFTGGATVAAAEAVCGAGRSTFDLLTALVDKSLVVLRDSPEARYGMLETIKAYGLDRLAEAGEADQTRGAHVRYFVAVAERAEPRLREADQLRWLARLGADHENLHSAIRRAIGAGDAENALRLCSALGWYWFLQGHRGEGSELTMQALALPGPSPLAVRALASAFGALNGFAMYPHPARKMITEAARLSAQVESTHPLLRLIAPLAQFFVSPDEIRGDATTIMASFSASFDDPDPWVRAAAHSFHAHSEFNVGRDAEAERGFLEGLAGFRAIGDRWGISFALATLAEAAAGHGEHQAAAGYLAEALAVISELGTNEDLSQMQTQYAHELLVIGETDRARVMLEQARRTADQVRLPECLVMVAFEDGEFARYDDELDRARAAYERALAILAGWQTAPQFRALISTMYASVLARQGEVDRARELNEQAMTDAVSSQDLPAIRRILVMLAEFALRTGDPVRAAELLGASADNQGRPNHGVMGAAGIVRDVRAALDPTSYAEAFARGQATQLADLASLTPTPR